MPELEIIDAENKPIEQGAQIDGGDGRTVGEVVTIEEDDEGGNPRVVVAWPGIDPPETFSTHARNYRREGPSGPYVWKCSEIEVVDG
jgi:hypothetical protein